MIKQYMVLRVSADSSPQHWVPVAGICADGDTVEQIKMKCIRHWLGDPEPLLGDDLGPARNVYACVLADDGSGCVFTLRLRERPYNSIRLGEWRTIRTVAIVPMILPNLPVAIYREE